MRVAYDSTTVADLPLDGDLYLGYVDGLYANVDAIKRRFPHKRVVGITVNGSSLDAEMADVEAGDLSPKSGAAWARRKVDRGEHPTLYTYASGLPAVKAAVKAAGLTDKQVSYFVARYGPDKTIPAGCVGVQWLSPDGPPNCRPPGHYDESAVAPYWPGVDPEPKPKPRRAPLGPVTRRAALLVTRHLKRRGRPLTAKDAAVVDDLIAAARHAKGVK